MALHRKLDALSYLKPDIAILSECATQQLLLQKSDLGQRVTDQIWVGTNPNKGLAVLAFNKYQLSLMDSYDPSLRFVAPIVVDGPVSFNLLAVWAQNANDGIRKKDQAGPLRISLDRYSDFLTGHPAVVAGDFNNNVLWDKPGWPMNHAEAVDVLHRYGLVSAYHEVRGEKQGSESTPTLYWRDRKKDGPTYHIDYIFLPRLWMNQVAEMTVGSFEDWCGSGLSDHVPIIVEVSL